MKAVRWKKLLWTLIILKFLDIMTTIIGLSLGATEMNPLGQEIVIGVSIIYLFIMFYMTGIFENKKRRAEYIKWYRLFVIGLKIDIAIYTIVVISNLSQLATQLMRMK